VRLGDLEVASVLDGCGSWPADRGFVPPNGWNRHREFLTADGRVPLDFGGFLVRPGDRVALVDAGAGPDHRSLPGGRLLRSLASLGVAPASVTDVLFTHLHMDHIGWASEHGEPVFPNATYRCHRDDWEYFIGRDGTGRDERVWDKLQPVEDRFELWDGSATLFPGVDLLPAPGHTPGSTVIVLSSRDDRALLLGDVVHCPAELLEEEWLVLGDVDPQLATRTRDSLARELEGTATLAAAAHFPGLCFGRVLVGRGRRSWRIQTT
jgi:glyoxylase-like metal-dependent hydrolase (beta-lactamase superfamily II)